MSKDENRFARNIHVSFCRRSSSLFTDNTCPLLQSCIMRDCHIESREPKRPMNHKIRRALMFILMNWLLIGNNAET